MGTEDPRFGEGSSYFAFLVWFVSYYVYQKKSNNKVEITNYLKQGELNTQNELHNSLES